MLLLSGASLALVLRQPKPGPEEVVVCWSLAAIGVLVGGWGILRGPRESETPPEEGGDF